MIPPTLQDIYAARDRVAPHVPRSPLQKHPLLDNESGLDIWVKHENHNPTGAFKIRGGLNLVGSLAPEARSRGIVAASTGNHGQSIALAARLCGMQATVFVPAGNNPEKNAAIRAFGAVLDEGGRDFDEARGRCEQHASETGARYAHSANEPLLLAGVGTYALELIEDLPDVDVVLVPIGGGSGACGLITVRNALGSKARIIGVGAVNANAVERSWRGGDRVIGTSADTLAEGIAARVTFDLHLRDSEGVPRRLHPADRRRARRGCPAGAADDAQPGGRRRGCIPGRGGQAEGLSHRAARRVHHVGRQSRFGTAQGNSGGVAAGAPSRPLNTSSYIAGVTVPVFVFCREG